MKKIDKYIKSLIQTLVLMNTGEWVLDLIIMLLNQRVPSFLIGLLALIIVTGILWTIDLLWGVVFE